MFTWPPPHCVIQFMSDRLFSQLSNKDNTKTSCHISYGHQFEQYDDVESAKNNTHFSSNVAIMPKQWTFF